MEIKTPSREHSALLTQAAYQLGEKGVNKTQRVANANKHVEQTGYVVNSEHSNSEVTAYQHKDDPNNIFIAHRGTKVDTDRRNKNMGGHSLGGGTLNHTIANSKTVRKHLTSAKTFNAAAHPVFSNGSAVSAKVKKELDNKVENHRIKNDGVSAGFLTGNVSFGKLKTHSVKHDASKGKSYFQNMIETGSALGRAKRFTEKGLAAHSISHFHDGSIKKKKKNKK